MFSSRFLCFALLVLLFGCSKDPTENFLPPGVTADALVASIDTDQPHETSIQAAIDAAPADGGWTIAIAPGEYYEHIVINKPNITLIGAGPDKTKIVFDRYAGKPVMPASEETLGAYRTATVEVTRTNATIANLTIENAFDFLTNDALEADDPKKIAGAQAIALKLAEYTDKTTVDNVHLLGYQNTLYVQGGRSYFRGGEIRGNIDIISGNGNGYFDNVAIVSRPRGKTEHATGYVTAPSTLITDAFGFTFVNCKLTREDGVPDNSVPLGRPWHPVTTFADGRYAHPFAAGKATFINTWMDKHITSGGWASMVGNTKDGSSHVFSPYDDARFAEFGSSGPGAAVNNERPQLSEEEKALFSAFNILDGWEPLKNEH